MRISKKILAIALSILMAVSMMPFTVFAATTHTVTTQAELLSALESAVDGDTIELDADITLAGKTVSGESAKYGAYITKSITLDGKNHKLTSTDGSRAIGVKGVENNVTVTFKDLTVSANSSKANAMCICTRGGIDTLTLDNVKLDTPGSGKAYNQPLTIGGTQYTQANVNVINGSVIQTNDNASKYYAIILWNPVKLDIQDSTIKGWACVYQKQFEDGTTDSTKVTINNSTLVSVGISGSTNHFAAIMTEEDNFSCEITNSNIDVTAAANTYQGIAASNGSSDGFSVELGDGNDVTMSGDTAIVGFNFDADEQEISVSGGTFLDENGDTYEVADYYLADDVAQTEAGKVIGIDPSTVALIGEQEFSTIQAAFNAVYGANTVKLVKDVTVSDPMYTYDNTTLDLGGHDLISTYNTNGGFLLSSSNLTVKGEGKLANYSLAEPGRIFIIVYSNASITVQDDAIVESNGTTISIAKANNANNAVINVEGGAVKSSTNAPISVNGQVTTTTAEINVSGGLVESATQAAIFAAGYATTNVTGGTVKGTTGIYAKSGVVNVTGGEIIATGEAKDYGYRGSGAVSTGDALVIDNCGYPGGAPTASITGGTFISENNQAVASYVKQDDETQTGSFERVDEIISGGEFSSDVTELLTEETKETVAKGTNPDAPFVIQTATAENAYSLTIDHSIAMNAYIDVDAYDGDAVRVTYNDADALDPSQKGTKTETFTTASKDEKDRWELTINQAPAQIADEVKFDIMKNGEVVRTIKTSVADYLVQASTSNDAELANLAKAMFDYGKSTCAASGYGADAKFTEAKGDGNYFNAEEIDPSVGSLGECSTTDGTVCKFTGLAFVATSTPSLRAYVDVDEATAVTAGLDHLDVSDATGKVCANLGSVNPEDFNKMLSVKINDGAEIQTNVIYYANRATENGAGDLGRSIRNYFAAARDYWA